MSVEDSTISKKQLRSFGLLMTGLFFVIGIWPWAMRGETARIWAMSISGVWGVMALSIPTLLTPVYKIWMKFAEKLGWFNTRVLLSLIFFTILTPISFLMKMFGKKPLHCRFDPQTTSYREVKAVRPSDHVVKQF